MKKYKTSSSSSYCLSLLIFFSFFFLLWSYITNVFLLVSCLRSPFSASSCCYYFFFFFYNIYKNFNVIQDPVQQQPNVYKEYKTFFCVCTECVTTNIVDDLREKHFKNFMKRSHDPKYQVEY